MEEYDLMEKSLMKNIQEFTEFIVDNLHITNYYDLVDRIIELNNFRARAYKKDKKLTLEIIKELEKENNK